MHAGRQAGRQAGRHACMRAYTHTWLSTKTPPSQQCPAEKNKQQHWEKNAHGVPVAQEARKSRRKTGRKNKNIRNKALVCIGKQHCGGARTAQIVAQDARKRANPCFVRVLYIPSQQNAGSYYVTNMCCCQGRGAGSAQ